MNVGCIPSKALLNATHKFYEAKHDFKEFGIVAKDVSIDYEQLMRQKDKAVGGLTSGIEFLFKKNKVDYAKGTGKFSSKSEIEVDLLAGGSEKIKAKNVIIATGSEPTPIPTIPVDEKHIVSSTGALSLEKIPKKLYVVGSGVIGLELGSVYSRLGAEVTVLGNMDRICPFLDNELSAALKKTLEKQGMKFILKTRVSAGRKTPNGCEVDIDY